MIMHGNTGRMRRSAVLLLAAILMAACGARLSDEQRAALETTGAAAPGASPVSAASGAIDTGSGDVTTTTTTVAGASPTTAATDAPSAAPGPPASADGGSGGSATPGSPATPAAVAPSCGGGGDADIGVTTDEIKLGNVSTISGPIPGFGQSGVDGAKAYVNFVNATGGVCGRKLTLVTADDRLQSGTNKSETDKLKSQVLGFVGGTTVVDDGAAQSIEGTNIVLTGLAISEAMIRSANNFPTVPINLADGGNNSVNILKYFKATRGVSKAALIMPDQASAKSRGQAYAIDLKRAGYDVVLQTTVPVTETNYADDAANIEAKGADLLITTLEVSGMSNLAKALEQNGYFPKVPFYGAQAYGRVFLKQAGSAAEPTVLGLSYEIPEDAASVPPVNDFITWYERTNPGADVDFFAIYGWVAAKMYVDVLRTVSGPPTRDKVLAKFQALTSYDADGMIAPVNPAQKQGATCFLIAKVDKGKWVRMHPDSPGFDCKQW